MKFVFLISLLLISFFAFSQGKKDTTAINISYQKGADYKSFHTNYYLDSAKMASMPYMDLNDIVSIIVKKQADSVNNNDGEIYIELKKKPYHFIGIDELTKKCIPDFDPKKQCVIYVIDEKFVPYSANIMFDATFIRNVEILKNSPVEFANGPLTNMIVLRINTKLAPVYIRGTSSNISIKQ